MAEGVGRRIRAPLPGRSFHIVSDAQRRNWVRGAGGAEWRRVPAAESVGRDGGDNLSRWAEDGRFARFDAKIWDGQRGADCGGENGDAAGAIQTRDLDRKIERQKNGKKKLRQKDGGKK